MDVRVGNWFRHGHGVIRWQRNIDHGANKQLEIRLDVARVLT